MHISVVGCGLLGAGIGLSFAMRGASVSYLVRDVERARAKVDAEIAELVGLGLLDQGLAGRITFHETMAELPPSEMIIESIPENRSLKVPLFAALSRAHPEALLFSNTSSLSITDIAAETRDPSRVAGMHFWYPAPLMPLVELVPGDLTSRSTLDIAERALLRYGKTPVRLSRDIPGFVWNRLVVAVLREAKSLVEQGVLTARDVDLVVELGLARRWSLTGPFASACLGGVATFETVGANLLPQLSAESDLGGLSGLLDGYVSDREGLNSWRNKQLAIRADAVSWSSVETSESSEENDQ